MKTLSKKEFVHGILPTFTWAIFLGTTYAALGRHHWLAIAVSSVAAISASFLVLSERELVDKNKITLSLVALGGVTLLLIIGINISGVNAAIGLAFWFLYGFVGYSVLQFSRNS